MPVDYSSTARELSLSLPRPDSPAIDPRPNRTAWPRIHLPAPQGRNGSPYGHEAMSGGKKIMGMVVKLLRRIAQTLNKLSILQKAAAIIFLLLVLTVTILLFVYNNVILEWLQPIAAKWKNLNGGWLILWALTFATAFPPLIGYSTCVTISGFVYGFPNGWFIVASATIAGSLTSLIVSRTVLSSFVRRLVANDSRFSALSLVLKHDGLLLLIMIRLCPLPYSLSNAALSTIRTVSPLMFALATTIASPKLLIHVFIGGRLAAIADNKENMDTGTKLVNYASIIGGIMLGIGTGYLIHQRTVARARQIAAEDGSKTVQRVGGFSRPREFPDQATEPNTGASNDDIDFLDPEAVHVEYRDDLDYEDDIDAAEFWTGVGNQSINLNTQHSRP